MSGVVTPDDLTYSSAQLDDYAFWAFWEGKYDCRPCKLINVSGVSKGAVLRLSWSGVVPMTLWAGDAYNAPSVTIRGEPGQSKLEVVAPPVAINTILVGFDPNVSPLQEGSETFTLSVEAP
jgi:hypothetical protein